MNIFVSALSAKALLNVQQNDVKRYVVNIVICIIAAAVRRNKLVAKATRSDIENVVKLWLRYAADRSGGRHARAARRRLSLDRADTDDSDE